MNRLFQTKEEARANGANKYFSGEECKRGHIAERWVYNGECFTCWSARRSRAHAADPAKSARQKREYRAKRPNSDAEFYQRNKEKIVGRVYAYNKRRKSEDPAFALAFSIRTRIWSALKGTGYGKRTKTAQMIGCSWEELRAHIERQFVEGMSWENRSLWHIDHIIPLSSAKSEEEMIALSHYTNLRPLWASDNLRKGCKMPSEVSAM